MPFALSSNPSSDLPAQAREWVRGVLGAGTHILSARQLPGATSSTLFALEEHTHDQSFSLVLRLFTNADWLAEEPDLALHEARALEKAQQTGLSAPRLVATDESGEACGVPAILFTRLPGIVVLKPANMESWLNGMAAAIQPLHTADVSDFPWQYQPYIDLDSLEPPTWSGYPHLWEQAIALARGEWRPFQPCLIHRDYHPNNILWQDGQVSGIVDFPNTCVGPQGIDPAWCRGNLLGLYGLEVADRFLQAYCARAGDAFVYDPFWDLMVLIEILPGPPDIYPPWLEYGFRASELPKRLLQARYDAYLQSLMEKI